MLPQRKETFFSRPRSRRLPLDAWTFLQKWQERKRETVIHPYLGEKLPWGLAPYVWSLPLARYLRGVLDEYPPFLWKQWD